MPVTSLRCGRLLEYLGVPGAAAAERPSNAPRRAVDKPCSSQDARTAQRTTETSGGPPELGPPSPKPHPAQGPPGRGPSGPSPFWCLLGPCGAHGVLAPYTGIPEHPRIPRPTPVLATMGLPSARRTFLPGAPQWQHRCIGSPAPRAAHLPAVGRGCTGREPTPCLSPGVILVLTPPVHSSSSGSDPSPQPCW